MRHKEIPMPDLNPDFRAMTEKDLRKGMSDINRTIKEMKTDTDRYYLAIEELKELRKRYKIVWRARPGRVFHDIAARKQREQDRRFINGGYFIPPFGM